MSTTPLSSYVAQTMISASWFAVAVTVWVTDVLCSHSTEYVSTSGLKLGVKVNDPILSADRVKL